MFKALARLLTRILIRPYRREKPATKSVAIVIPMSMRVNLDADEEISMRHLRRYLSTYDKYLVAPEGLVPNIEGCEVKYFPRKYFGSAAAHAKMLYDPAFYRAFEDYEFVFFYHLDSLVFSDQMEYWCSRDIDYIGAPWINCADSPWVTKPRVGNCGFALLRVGAALEVLYNRYQIAPASFWLDLFTRNAMYFGPLIWLMARLNAIVPNFKMLRIVLNEVRATENPGPSNRNTDIFWSDHAVTYLPSFRVASFEDGLKFAFEVSPRTCYEQNGKSLPFGCHAWARYDRTFWESFLLAPELVPAGEVPADQKA